MSNIGKDAHDRELREYWEDQFCTIARSYGWEAWPFQRERGAMFTDQNDKRYICPDVWILRRGNRQYAVEVKHKIQARNSGYGFEKYRADSLMKLERNYQNQFGGVVALYIVHNWARAGGKYSKVNKLEHWHGERLSFLESIKIVRQSDTLYNGQVVENFTIHYYPNPLKNFKPLEYFLG